MLTLAQSRWSFNAFLGCQTEPVTISLMELAFEEHGFAYLW